MLMGILAASRELPPRARRIPRPSRTLPKTSGTTSACAENTRCNLYSVSGNRNYLRVRGEYRTLIQPGARCWELPPRARRILLALTCDFRRFGTTSACAENTNSLPHKILSIWNYLRVRGEYRLWKTATSITSELPSRARRIRELRRVQAENARTTSACAENT